MGKLVKGDMVVLPFPFSDFALISHHKVIAMCENLCNRGGVIMDKDIRLYKKFMEGLLGKRPDIYAESMKKNSKEIPWPKIEMFEKFNNLYKNLCNEDKLVLADVIQSTRDDAMFDVLEYLDENIELEGLNVTQNGIKFPNDFWGGDFHCDWAGLCQGDMWGEDRK